MVELMTDTVHRAQVALIDEYGDPQPGSPIAIRCRIEEHVSNVSGERGERKIQTKIFTDRPIGVNDFVWLPGQDIEDLTRAKRPVSVTFNRVEQYVLYEVML